MGGGGGREEGRGGGRGGEGGVEGGGEQRSSVYTVTRQDLIATYMYIHVCTCQLPIAVVCN